MSWGKKSKKKPSVLTNFHFLVNFIRHTGPMVTSCIGGLSQRQVVKISWGEKSKKKPSVLTNFHFLVNFIRHTDPMVTMVASCTGGLSQLPVVKIGWEKKSKKTPSVLTNFHFLVNFIRHTDPMVTMVIPGHKAHRQPISALNLFKNNPIHHFQVGSLEDRCFLAHILHYGCVYTHS